MSSFLISVLTHFDLCCFNSIYFVLFLISPIEIKCHHYLIIFHHLLSWFTESVWTKNGGDACICHSVVSFLETKPFQNMDITRDEQNLILSLSLRYHRLFPICLYLAYLLTSFITTTLLIANSDQSQVFHNESKYCTRWAHNLQNKHLPKMLPKWNNLFSCVFHSFDFPFSLSCILFLHVWGDSCSDTVSK